jgi:glycosyltransferase involved in cell wall biosynthesis
MKVLVLCHSYPPTWVAGVERLTAQVAETLTSRRHEVTVVTRRPAVEPRTFVLERDTRGGVPVVTIAGAGGESGHFPAREPALERIFERLLVEIDPDVVLATHLLYHSPGCVDVAHRWGVPIVLELHDHFAICPRAHLQRTSGDPCDGPEGGRACARHCFPDMPEAELRWALRAKSFAEAVRGADEVVAPSRFLADELAPLRGSGLPIKVLDNAVPELGPVLRPERDPDAPLHLASIGVTTEHKGFHVVVEALRLVEIPARYTIFGLPLQPAASELREAAEAVPGLELRLFGGFQPAHLPVLLADVDAAVVPSLVPETFSIVTREAFACGLPVIASRIGALPEAIRHGEDGWLFEPGDSIELAALICRIDEHRDLLSDAAGRVRSKGRVGVRERTIRVERLLEEVVARGAGEDDAEGLELRLMREALAEEDAVRRSGLASRR